MILSIWELCSSLPCLMHSMLRNLLNLDLRVQKVIRVKGIGDPASDNQILSFNGNNLTISGGNTVNLSTLNVPHQLTLLGDTLSILGGNKVGLTNQIQDLQLDVNNKLKITKNPSATAIDLSKFNQTLNFNSADNKLTISGGSAPIDLTALKNDADSDPANELQTLIYNRNTEI